MEEGQTVSQRKGQCYDIVLPHISTVDIQPKIARQGEPYDLVMLEDMVYCVQKGDLVLDGGAHVGNHTLYLVTIDSCMVVAFEPNATLAAALRHSVSRYILRDVVDIKCLGLGMEDGYGRFGRDILSNLGSQSIEPGSGEVRITRRICISSVVSRRTHS